MIKLKLVILFLLISSCITVSNKYTPKVNVNNLTVNEKKDITFSISYLDLSGINKIEESKNIESNIIQTIRHKFMSSNLFNSVKYTMFDNKSKYHYHFTIKLTGTTPEESMALGFIAGYTLTLIPVAVNYDLDVSMFIYKNDKEIYSISTTESIKDIIWLPMILFTPFFNHLTVLNEVKNRIINYFIGELVDLKLY